MPTLDEILGLKPKKKDEEEVSTLRDATKRRTNLDVNRDVIGFLTGARLARQERERGAAEVGTARAKRRITENEALGSDPFAFSRSVSKFLGLKKPGDKFGSLEFGDLEGAPTELLKLLATGRTEQLLGQEGFGQKIALEGIAGRNRLEAERIRGEAGKQEALIQALGTLFLINAEDPEKQQELFRTLGPLLGLNPAVTGVGGEGGKTGTPTPGPQSSSGEVSRGGLLDFFARAGQGIGRGAISQNPLFSLILQAENLPNAQKRGEIADQIAALFGRIQQDPESSNAFSSATKRLRRDLTSQRETTEERRKRLKELGIRF